MDINAENGILIIDADESRRRQCEEFFNSLGTPATSTSNGENGLELATRLRPFAVIIDISITDADAHLVCAKLKSLIPQSCVMLVVDEDNAHERKFGQFVWADGVFSREGGLKAIYDNLKCIYGNRLGRITTQNGTGLAP